MLTAQILISKFVSIRSDIALISAILCHERLKITDEDSLVRLIGGRAVLCENPPSIICQGIGRFVELSSESFDCLSLAVGSFC
jgi:hypothetical protein